MYTKLDNPSWLLERGKIIQDPLSLVQDCISILQERYNTTKSVQEVTSIIFKYQLLLLRKLSSI